MYTIKNNKVYRGDEAIADVVGDQLDFYEGMAKFRAPAVRMFNAVKKDAVKDISNAETKPKVEIKKPKKVEKKDYLQVISEICGVEITKPHPVKGFKSNRYHALIKKKYNDIIKSEEIDDSMKRSISNMIL